MSSPEMVFNELSLSFESDENQTENWRDELRSLFLQYAECLAKLISEECARSVLRTSQDLYNRTWNISNGDTYSFQNWQIDGRVDREARLFLTGLTTKIPAEDGLPTDQIDRLAGETFGFQHAPQHPVWGGAVALVGSHVLTSLRSDAVWNAAKQKLVHIPGSGSVFEVLHASDSSHALEISSLQLAGARQSILDAENFKSNAGSAFPNLIFLPQVFKQMSSLPSETFDVTIDKLSRMDETAKEWRESDAGFPEFKFDWRNESESVNNDKKLKRAREFKMKNGEKKFFEPHMSLSSRHRLHFLIDDLEKTFIVGYVGDHLPTKKHK